MILLSFLFCFYTSRARSGDSDWLVEEVGEKTRNALAFIFLIGYAGDFLTSWWARVFWRGTAWPSYGCPLTKATEYPRPND